MKKFFRVFTLLAALTLAIAGAAYADTKIGVADMQRILFNHPNFEQVSKRIEAVYRSKEQELKVPSKRSPTRRKAPRRSKPNAAKPRRKR